MARRHLGLISEVSEVSGFPPAFLKPIFSTFFTIHEGRLRARGGARVWKRVGDH
jgi:hypothetical protein